jgi:hypothetical protein
MSETIDEKRSTPRAQYFLINQVGVRIPIFAFRPEDDSTALAVLVVDAAEGGVQVLSAQGRDIEFERYELEAMRDALDEVSKRIKCEVQRVWSRQDGMYTKSGFSFVGDTSQTAELRNTFMTSDQGLLRCVLRPVTVAA